MSNAAENFGSEPGPDDRGDGEPPNVELDNENDDENDDEDLDDLDDADSGVVTDVVGRFISHLHFREGRGGNRRRPNGQGNHRGASQQPIGTRQAGDGLFSSDKVRVYFCSNPGGQGCRRDRPE